MNQFRDRRYVFAAAIILVGLLFMIRLFHIQIIDKSYEQYALSNAQRVRTIYPARGLIYDRNGKGLALSCALKSIYVKPLELENIEDATAKLSSLLGRKQQELLSALRSERSFVWMGRKLDSVKADKINALGIKGVYLVDEFQRYYPYLNSAAHVVGFVKDELPLAGLEFYYDQLLRTTPHVNKKLNFHYHYNKKLCY